MKIKTCAENRKDIVKAIEKAAGVKLKYLGPPSFAYAAEGITVDREGNVEAEKYASEIRTALSDEGLLLEDTVSIKVPLDGFTTENIISLVNLIYSKQKLLNAAVGADAFYVGEEVILVMKENKPDAEYIRVLLKRADTRGFILEGDAVTFTGFEHGQSDEILAYCTVAAMMVAHAGKHSRTHAKLIETENEKYAMRIWLNQLGLSGKGGKDTRTVMMKRLKGSAAFRTSESEERWKENRKKVSNKEL